MPVTVRRDPEPLPDDYGTIPISFTTTSILRIEWQSNGLNGLRITEVPIGSPLAKDFDDGEPVSRWLQFGDISHWGFFGAYEAGQRVGGAVVAHHTPTVRMLKGRTDLAVLWDIRMCPVISTVGHWELAAASGLAVCLGSGLRRAEGGVPEHQSRRVPLLRQARIQARRRPGKRVPRVSRRHPVALVLTGAGPAGLTRQARHRGRRRHSRPSMLP